MAKIRMLAIGNHLEIERALTKQERNRILDAADQLLLVGGRSRDRHRHGGTTPPQRESFRPYRNRALIETGMRRAAIRDYLEHERREDKEKWQSHALFLASSVSPHGDARLKRDQYGVESGPGFCRRG